MSYVGVSELAYAPPGDELLFSDVSFTIGSGEHVALIGDNGVGKSTLLKLIAGQLTPDIGFVSSDGDIALMAQNVGFDDAEMTIRGVLLQFASPALREVDQRVRTNEERACSGDAVAGAALASALSDWGDLGGYELDSQLDGLLTRLFGFSMGEIGGESASDLSGGERKRLVFEYLITSSVPTLLLDEPDNYMDIPAKELLAKELRRTKKTVLLVSHDRALLSVAVNRIITVEPGGAWVHHGTYATYVEAREKRRESLGDELRRWQGEERRLHHYYRIMKQRAAINDNNAPRADAAESRWKRFVAEGPPPPPPPEQKVRMRLAGSEGARVALEMVGFGHQGLFEPFSTSVRFGEQIGLVGPNGTGKTTMLNDIAAAVTDADAQQLRLGPRTEIGVFTQANERPEFARRPVLDVVREYTDEQGAMNALARYGLAGKARREFNVLSGGQKARVEVLLLELSGKNLLLLDEPTDNLDIDSSVALEKALDGLRGSVIAVSHDRFFLQRMDRYLFVARDGSVYDVPSFEVALSAIENPDGIADLRFVRRLSTANRP